jgi:hypothetical protein
MVFEWAVLRSLQQPRDVSAQSGRFALFTQLGSFAEAKIDRQSVINLGKTT